MRNSKLFLILLVVILNSTNLYGQDSQFFDNLDALFDDPTTSSPPTSTKDHSTTQSDQDTADMIFDDFSAQTLTLYGAHNIHMPIPLNPDYLDFNSKTRTLRQENLFGLQYVANHVEIVSELNADMWVNESYDIVSMMAFGFGENYISMYNDMVKLKLGFQNYSWGAALGFNAIDELNNFNYQYGIRAKRIPSFSTSFSIHPLPIISLELIYIPFYTKSLFSEDPIELIKTNIEKSISSLDPNIRVELNENTLDFDFSRSQLGTRLNFYLPIADLALSYIYDIDNMLTIISNDVSLIDPKLLSYTLERFRIHRVALDITAPISRMSIWANLTGNITEDVTGINTKIRNPNLRWTLGFDYSVGNDNRFYFAVQQIGKYIFNYNQNIYHSAPLKNFNNADVLEDTIEYQNYIIGRDTEALNLGLLVSSNINLINEQLIPKIEVGYFMPFYYDKSSEQRYGSLLLRPAIEISPNDAVNINFGAELGFSWIAENGQVILNKNDALGQATKNNRMYIELVYQWSKLF